MVAEDDDEASKTEEPSERKISKAKEEGDVALSQDAKSFLMLLGMLFVVWLLLPILMKWFYQLSLPFIENPESIPTDARHIRLLLITFFLQFFPDLIKKGHVYILQTPLFRVRNKKKTLYCYSEEERVNAINELSPNPEITRFKGLGEISPDEFKHFIGKDMRLEQVTLRKTDAVKELLEFYMGKNTMERQNFIIDNLVIEEDLAS